MQGCVDLRQLPSHFRGRCSFRLKSSCTPLPAPSLQECVAGPASSKDWSCVSLPVQSMNEAEPSKAHRCQALLKASVWGHISMCSVSNEFEKSSWSVAAGKVGLWGPFTETWEVFKDNHATVSKTESKSAHFYSWKNKSSILVLYLL